MTDWIIPDWPAPARVRSVITGRRGGCSDPPYDGLNLAAHVGDNGERVRRNREYLSASLALPSEPLWLQQVHGCEVAECGSSGLEPTADAVTAADPGRVCAVLTADCLPLLLCNRKGNRVAAVHAGWRGLAAGVIEAALAVFDEPGGELLAWFGPAIGPDVFEVGDEVRERFLQIDSRDEAAFVPSASGRWLANIYLLAENRLRRHNLGFLGGGSYCTFSQPERFFSYRRDGTTGRMASLIWIEPH
jgi:YfiH family protein